MLNHGFKNPNAMRIERLSGTQGCRKPASLNMKLWNNCVLFIYCRKMILGIQLPGCWPIFRSEAIKRKFSSYEPHCLESGTKKDLRIILSSWKQEHIKWRCQETQKAFGLVFSFRAFRENILWRQKLLTAVAGAHPCAIWVQGLGFTTQLLCQLLSLFFLAPLLANGEQETLWMQLQMSISWTTKAKKSYH